MRSEAYRSLARQAVLISGLLAFLPAQAATQGILGQLLDDELGRPVVAAQVVLVDAAGNVVGRALSGSGGRFFIAVDLGTYSLVISRLGYEPEHVADVEITSTSVLPVQIRLSPDAVQLPGLIVQGERRGRLLESTGFYERKQRGFGHHIEVEESRRLQTFEPSELLRRIPGLVVRDGVAYTLRRSTALDVDETKPCRLQVMVDGMYRGIDLDEVLLVREIEAIEVYVGPASVPGQWHALATRGYMDSSVEPPIRRPTCGVVVVWTRH